MIDQTIINKIFDAAAIEEVVGGYVSLKRNGANFKGLCPFHDDKNASMVVSPSKGIFKCFSCGQAGNVFQFVMEHEGLSFPLAARFLGEKYHIIIEDNVSSDDMKESQRVKQGVLSCLEYAKSHFHQRLNESQEGKTIYRPYLNERGIQQSTIDKLHIGLSGIGRTDLMQEAIKNGYTVHQLYDSGLVKKIDEAGTVIESNLRDTFIERIVFPIYSISGKVLGFGGRVIKKDTKAPKYLNSPETIVYEKRKELYGLSHAKNEIRKLDCTYIVEGYMDVASLGQSGIDNVVAASGTSFTEEQTKTIRRFTENVVLLSDGDVAGVNACMKHIKTFIAADVSVTTVIFPKDEDPDSYIQKNGSNSFQEYVEVHSKNFIDFIISVMVGSSEDPIKKSKAAQKISETLATVPNSMNKAQYLKYAAKRLGIDATIILEQSNLIKAKLVGPNVGAADVPNDNPFIKKEEVETVNYQERDLLYTLIEHGHKRYDQKHSVASYIFFHLEESEIWPISEPYHTIFKEAYAEYSKNNKLHQSYFVLDLKASVIAAEALQETHTVFDWAFEVNIVDEINDKINYLKLRHINDMISSNIDSIANETEEQKMVDLNLLQVQLNKMKSQILQSL
jgi:DNA primase